MLQKTVKSRTIFCRDNLEILRGIDDNSIDLIYLDPPFNTKKQFTAPIGTTAEGATFHDYFSQGDIKEEWLGLIADKYPLVHEFISGISNIGYKSNKYYLCYMAIRLIEMHRILADTGSIYLHCDQTMSHYLKLLLGCVFGEENFRNEIIWKYGLGGSSPRLFSKKHDNLYFYTKTGDYCFNKPSEPSTSAMMAGNPKGMIDVWDIPSINNMARERTGYPTQKPIMLLSRIVGASSKEGDVVLDPFCGCATTCVAAERLGRQWIGIDISEKAFELVNIRLQDEVDNWELVKGRDTVIMRRDIPARTVRIADFELVAESPLPVKQVMFGRQHGICQGCKLQFNYHNLTIDHIIPKDKGGGDNIENLQLLCGHCNSVKGNRPMEVLLLALKEKKIGLYARQF